MLQSETVVEDERIRGRTGTGDGREMAGVGVLKRWERGELGGGEITQQGLLFRSRKSAKGRKPRKKVREPVIQGK